MKMSRREALQYLAGGVLAVVGAERIISQPQPVKVEINNQESFLPPELLTHSLFFSRERGHEPFLFELSHHELVNAATRSIGKKIFEGSDRAHMGQVMVETGREVYDLIAKYHPDLSEKRLIEETVHILSIATACTFNHHFSSFADVIRIFGKETGSEFSDSDHFFWQQDNPTGLLLRFPEYYGRWDHTSHISNHIYLVFEYYYLTKHFQHLSSSMPTVVNFGIKFDSDPIKQATTLSEIAGTGYEIRSTLRIKEMWRRALSGKLFLTPINDGLLDPNVKVDFAANKLGSSIGQLLAKAIADESSWDEVEAILMTLDDPKHFISRIRG